MNIGILSMQQIKNYGSFLQAFSLKINIEALGHSCEFINIVPGKQLGEYKYNIFHKYILLFLRLLGWDVVKRFRSIYTFQLRFSKEFFPLLGVKQGINTKHYDVVIIGSDEVFNCAQKTWFGFSKQLFGKGLNADKVITYAASFGATTVEKLCSLKIKDDVAILLKEIDTISVRDANSFSIVNELINSEPYIHLDPVFLFNYDKLMPDEVALKDYMIVYTYPGRITDKKEIQSIKDFAKSKDLKLISIGHYFPWCDEVVIPSPFEVLAYFKYASYIITDTFHGSIFSIKYNKPFCTIVRKMNNNKLQYLLKQFDLEDRIWNYNNIDLHKLFDIEINYTPVNQKIVDEIQKSFSYLEKEIIL